MCKFWLPALAASLVLGCAAWRSPEPTPVRPSAESPPPGTLRVSLSFGDAADLDLYVTDPRHETVYFANSPSTSGGTLVADLRCSAPLPRVETVIFEDPLPGRYRVGVDYPERCRTAKDPIPFVVVIEAEDVRREERGQIELGRFLPIVLEVEVGRVAPP